jgi:peptidoglycan/LPS O-acetylase OafA/YrhL
MKFHLKGLDTYRAIAAITVVVGHIELFKSNYHIPNLLKNPFFEFTGGRTGVMLFFALSGYLITALLLKEFKTNGKIDFKSFYIRRILRVWPLYYIIIFLSLFVLNYKPTMISFILCISIFPNVAHMLHQTWWASPQLWSLGVEEQFYLFWPLIIAKIKNQFLAILILFLFFTFGLTYFGIFIYRITQNANVLSLTSEMAYDLKFNCMAAGGLMAYFQFKNSAWLNVFKKYKPLAWFSIVLPFLLWWIGFHSIIYLDEFYACLFAISIWNISENELITFNPDWKPIKFLGKISYGIYMYHWIILTLLLNHFTAYFKTNSYWSNFALYTTSLALTILVAYISYQFIEKRFLTLKEKFSSV